MSGPCIYCTADTSGVETLEHPIPEAMGSRATLPRDYCCLRCNGYVSDLDQCVTYHSHLASMIVLGSVAGKSGRIRKTIQDGVQYDATKGSLDIDATKGVVSIDGDRITVHMHEDRTFDPRKFSRGLHKIGYALACLKLGREAMLTPSFNPLRNYIRRPQPRDYWPYWQHTLVDTLNPPSLVTLVQRGFKVHISRDPALPSVVYVDLLVDAVVISLLPGLGADALSPSQLAAVATTAGSTPRPQEAWHFHRAPKESVLLA